MRSTKTTNLYLPLANKPAERITVRINHSQGNYWLAVQQEREGKGTQGKIWINETPASYYVLGYARYSANKMAGITASLLNSMPVQADDLEHVNLIVQNRKHNITLAHNLD